VRPFRFTLQAVPRGSRREWQDLARRAEDLGFDGISMPDHVGIADPWLPLVSAADATTRLRVGHTVINAGFHNPVLFARQAATADLLTDGRLLIGAGAGYARAEHDAIGIPMDPPGARVTRFEQWIAVVDELLRTGRTSSHGVFDVDVETLGVSCVQVPRPPLLIGGEGHRMLSIAASIADVIELLGFWIGPDGKPHLTNFTGPGAATRIEIVRAAAGARFADIELSALLQSEVVQDDASAAVADLHARFGLSSDDIDSSPFVLVGSLDHVCDKLTGLRETLGLSAFTVRNIDVMAPVVARLAGTPSH
jgi:probable F420-dependent oxidoreductase